MKKTGLILTFLLLGLGMFAQYTGNKLPSGLTVADTASDADYTIIQKNGETYVKAIRMDSLQSYMVEGINSNITSLDSVAGDFGQFVISDGTGFLSPVSAKYEGTDAYTFGQRLSGAVGSGSFLIGRGRAVGVGSVAIWGSAYADYSLAVGGTSRGVYSFSFLGGRTRGDADTSFCVGGTTGANASFAMGAVIANHYKEFVFGHYNDTTVGSRTTWVLTDRLFSIGKGTATNVRSNALTIYKNGNATINGNWNFTDTIMAAEGFIKNKAHGFYAFEDSAIVINMTDDTWAQVTNSTNTLFTAVQDGAGFTISGDTIYFTQASMAGTTPHIVFHYGIDGYGSINNDFECRIFNVSNNAGVMRKAEKSGEGASNRISLGTTAYDNQAAFGDAYIIQVRNTTNNDDLTVENGSIYLEVSHY